MDEPTPVVGSHPMAPKPVPPAPIRRKKTAHENRLEALMREARQRAKRQALATKDANARAREAAARAAAPKKKRKKKKESRATQATSTSARRRVLKFRDRPVAHGVGSGRAPPAPPPGRNTLVAAAHAEPAYVRRLHGSASAPELRPRTRAAARAMGIPGSIAPRSGGLAASTTALVRRPSDPLARIWSAGEAQFARRNVWYAVLTQADDAARPSGVGLPSGRTPTVGAGGVGAARGEFAHFQHCDGPGGDDGDDDLTPRPRFVERLKKKTRPRLRSDLMFQRDAGICRGSSGAGLAYRTRVLAPID